MLAKSAEFITAKSNGHSETLLRVSQEPFQVVVCHLDIKR